MASYRIEIKRSAQKEITAVGTKKDRQRIVQRIQELASDPRPPGVEKLSGSPYYRVRQGVYRIVYEIQNDVLIIHILKVGHRKDIYR
ncbi:MAG: type II toxin-antitoxin system mRNA interferase toxin, RelE/StbE family [Bacteroidetes bacterium CG12_big_fil_rev_8_21_14_0_65_60_17]|nr:MAG: type II toxin-antitoxin system mRNA interferase toxin, RelE/StbE family [Bacteroidetes bacterium CG12_big_fil_rev_8_21_14_0_65_60_17]